jgi:hypothetical protein
MHLQNGQIDDDIILETVMLISSIAREKVCNA